MVKFSRELDTQLIPEWRDAFVDYYQLKKLVKKIKVFSNNKADNYCVRAWGFGIRSILIQSIRHMAERVAPSLRSFHESMKADDDDDAVQMRSEYGDELEVETGINGDEGEAHGNGNDGVNLLPWGLQLQTTTL